MGEKRSYQIDDWGENTENNPEIIRLKYQMELTLDKERIIWDHLELKDGIEILEPGSGPGWFTKELLNYYPNSKITIVEIDPKMNTYFKKNMNKEELDRVTMLEESVTETSLQDNQFDFIFLRAVLQHLPDPDSAIKEMYRVLKPGGKFYIMDGDSGVNTIIDPHMPKGETFRDKINEKFQKPRKGNPEVSRYLPKILKNHGFKEVDFHGIAIHSEVTGMDMFRVSNKIENFKPYLDSGLTTIEEVNEIIREGEEFMDNPKALFLGFGFVTTGIK